MGQKRKQAIKIICPRCGKEGYAYTVNIKGKPYWYVSHTINGQRTIHYIGPAESYSYVERIHDLGLKDLKDQNYLETALRALENYISKIENDEERDREGDKKLLDLIKEKIQDIESILS